MTPLTPGDLSAMPGLAVALDAAWVAGLLGCSVSSATIVRRKPQRRVLVRYETARGPMLGKVRAGHRASTPFRLAASLRAAGLTGTSADGVAVPEPIAVCAEHGLWIQRVVPGQSIEAMLGSAGVTNSVQRRLGRRAADAALAIHRAGVPPRRRHGADDELAILMRRFDAMLARRSDWTDRIDALRPALSTLAGALADRPVCGIHRDFYPDQLLVDGDRVTVVDFDLYCLGDPAVDIGNFIAHVIELALRHHCRADALDATIDACVSTYLAGAGPSHRSAIEAYATLTLARLVSLSLDLDGRHHVAAPLLDIVEQRLTA